MPYSTSGPLKRLAGLERVDSRIPMPGLRDADMIVIVPSQAAAPRYFDENEMLPTSMLGQEPAGHSVIESWRQKRALVGMQISYFEFVLWRRLYLDAVTGDIWLEGLCALENGNGYQTCPYCLRKDGVIQYDIMKRPTLIIDRRRYLR